MKARAITQGHQPMGNEIREGTHKDTNDTCPHTNTHTNATFVRTSTGTSVYCACIAVLDVLQILNSINENLGTPTHLCSLNRGKGKRSVMLLCN